MKGDRKHNGQKISKILANFLYNQPVSSFQPLQHLPKQLLQHQLESSSTTMKTELANVSAPQNTVLQFLFYTSVTFSKWGYKVSRHRNKL